MDLKTEFSLADLKPLAVLSGEAGVIENAQKAACAQEQTPQTPPPPTQGGPSCS